MIVENNIPLKRFTTIHIGGKSGKIHFPESLDDILSLSKILLLPKTLVIGKGSNIAFSDNGYKFDIVSLRKYVKGKITLFDDNKISVSAGISCARFAKYCHKKSISGFEFLHGIPGVIGGALAMNAGAFNQSIWNHVESVNVINKKGFIENIAGNDINASYRSIDKENILLFLDVILKIDKNKIFDKKILIDFLEYRNRTQPIGQWSSGCIFKNPSKKISASSLIDSLKLKQRKFGGIYISTKHCNYFINDGNGSCDDLVQLINHVTKLVKKKYNIALTKEICIYRDDHE
ncbi:MAG: UDP-N-acetylmuramate dehydrogenase [Gammaproteobacteria bacterium]|nr:UDP-N-acetylmuramate dehydrogenase [Gammaproteobacteria bacterium]MBT7237129.1 UDP-N-acetylmuramate dehydrogenase [Gammaproteobacteria bacterium]